LKELGVGDSISKALTEKVVAGGALLLAQTPSGSVDENQAWQVIEQCGGSGVHKATVEMKVDDLTSRKPGGDSN
jgi:hypothetical protein